MLKKTIWESCVVRQLNILKNKNDWNGLVTFNGHTNQKPNKKNDQGGIPRQRWLDRVSKNNIFYID